eukprot:141004-Hanusia_phi.AAC.3
MGGGSRAGACELVESRGEWMRRLDELLIAQGLHDGQTSNSVRAERPRQTQQAQLLQWTSRRGCRSCLRACRGPACKPPARVATSELTEISTPDLTGGTLSMCS